MTLLAPALSVTLSQRRWRCVLDPMLALTPHGLMLAKQLGDLLELWVVRELWQILDNTHFYLQNPEYLQPSKVSSPTLGKSLRSASTHIEEQSLYDWEEVRLESDLAGLNLYWIGDAIGQSLLPETVNKDIVEQFEALAQSLDNQYQSDIEMNRPLHSVFRDMAAATAALDSAFILTIAPLAELEEAPEPLICTMLRQWGLRCEEIDGSDRFAAIEREHLQALIAHAGLSKLVWSGARLALLHLMLPKALSFQLQQHRVRQNLDLNPVEPWPSEATDWNKSTTRNPINPWENAQGFWFLL